MILAFLLGIPFAWWMVILALLLITDVACFALEAYGWSLTIMTVSIAGAIWLDHGTASSWIAANLHHVLLVYVPAYIALGLGTALVKWILFAAKRVGWIREAKESFDAKRFEPKVPDFENIAGEQAAQELREKLREKLIVPGGYNDIMKFMSDTDQEAHKNRAKELTVELKAKFEAMQPELKRRAFVDFYEDNLGSRNHKIYKYVDYSKDTAVVDALSPRAKDNIGKITIWIYQWPIVIVASLIEDFIIKLAKHFARALDAMFSKIVRGMVAKATKGL
jgi:GNAT superfamily N-acetyltransferase